jgi:hypothetical protein
MGVPRKLLLTLLKDYSLEEILEASELEPIDALELLDAYGALDVSSLIEATDENSS